MCGILGAFGRNSFDDCGFKQALNTLSHRGPDDEGLYIEDGVMLGHRRLSIIDLTSAGHQPFIDVASGLIIVFNGEIYNFIEIKAILISKGYHFRSDTDTEVLLSAYHEWGASCLSKLNGMFAFAIYNPHKKKVFFARDRFGVKPFYYYCLNDQFIFASEPKAILSLIPECRKPEVEMLYRFLQFGDLHNNPKSFYRNVYSLMPASCGSYCLQTKKISINRYWDYPQQVETIGRSEDVLDEFCDLLDDSVSLRLRSDVPVGITLSGGLDSTSILASVAKSKQEKITCFTSVYDSDSSGESGWARIASQPYQERVKLTKVSAVGGAWLESMKKIIWHMDGPGFSPAVYPLWQIMKKAKSEKIPVLLEGQGADELLGGYVNYSVIGFIHSFRHMFCFEGRVGLGRIIKDWVAISNAFGFKSSLLWLFREIMPFLVEFYRDKNSAGSAVKKRFVEEYAGLVRGTEDANYKYPGDPVSKQLFADHSNIVLPSLLHYGDSISMAHSVESRQPFLDYRLVEMLFKIPFRFKINVGRSKWMLRDYLLRSNQCAVSQRTDKVGYLTPAYEWMVSNDCEIPKSFLLNNNSRILEYCEKDKICNLISRMKNRKFGADNHIYRLLTTEIWLRELF